jgi:hypothetical protein
VTITPGLPLDRLAWLFLDHPVDYVGSTLMIRLPAGATTFADGSVSEPTDWVEVPFVAEAACDHSHGEQGVCNDCLDDYLTDYEVRLVVPLPSASYATTDRPS